MLLVSSLRGLYVVKNGPPTPSPNRIETLSKAVLSPQNWAELSSGFTKTTHRRYHFRHLTETSHLLIGDFRGKAAG